jgi:hypothetical protein
LLGRRARIIRASFDALFSATPSAIGRRAPLPIAADNRGAAPDQNVPRGALREPPAAPVAQGADS